MKKVRKVDYKWIKRQYRKLGEFRYKVLKSDASNFNVDIEQKIGLIYQGDISLLGWHWVRFGGCGITCEQSVIQEILNRRYIAMRSLKMMVREKQRRRAVKWKRIPPK